MSIIYRHEMESLEENAFEKTELIMKSIEANRDYVQDVLRPTMYRELGEKRFILEAMSSSYITRMIMENFNKKSHGFIYRRVAMDAKNPEYEANPLETEMIKRFRNDPQLAEWQGIIELESRKYFMRFQPVIFKESCLSCHGRPEESELFGYTRGAFTNANQGQEGLFTAANGGTLCLDEVGDIPFAIQSKLLRVLQEGEIKPLGSTRTIKIDVRIIALTNLNLEKMIADRLFREDLFYRLNVVTLTTPSLKDMAEDIPLFVAHFAKKSVLRTQSPPQTLRPVGDNRLDETPLARKCQGIAECCAKGRDVLSRRYYQSGRPQFPGESAAAGS